MSRVDDLLKEMTIEEKISMLAGADLWHSVGIPRLGIPQFKTTDGPNGARGAWGSMSTPSVATPVGIALGATWNPELIEKVGSTPMQRDSVKAVAMDMWPAFMGAANQCLPQADIVHDKFHISKYLGQAVDTVRKQEHRQLAQAGTSALSGSKWAWLRSYPDGRSAEAVSFRALNQLNLKTSRAWAIKENFTQFWAYYYKGSAKRFFNAWATHAMRSRLEPIKKVVKMLRRHETGLLNFSQHRISNACAEGFNSAIQLIKANARGFRNFTNYRARILFHCGKLDLACGR